VTSASKLSLLDKFEWTAEASMLASTSHMMGNLGFHFHSPMYLLMPLMMRWSIGDSHAENDRPASMWADCRYVMYDLMVLGCSLLAPPSHATHSSNVACDAGKIELSVFLN